MFNDIPSGQRVPKQEPLDAKVFPLTESALANLGTANNLAYTYFERMRAICRLEGTEYEWREVQSGEENTGLVATDFTYPPAFIVDGVDYSNRTFNFFLVLQAKDIEIPNPTPILYDAVNIGNGEELLEEVEEDIDGNITFKFNSLTAKDESIIITEGTGELDFKLNHISTGVTPIYINTSYIPSYADFLDANNLGKGEGTILKPFTNTIVYDDPNTSLITANSAVQNAIDYYIGTGGAGTLIDPVLPQRLGELIVIQSNVTINAVQGLNIANLNLKLEDGVTVTNTGNYIWDATLFTSSLYTPVNILISNNAVLIANENGFRNDSSANTTINITMLGSGKILQPVILVNTNTYSIIKDSGNDSNTPSFIIRGGRLESYSQQIVVTDSISSYIDSSTTEFVYGIYSNIIGANVRPFKLYGGAFKARKSSFHSVSDSGFIESLFTIKHSGSAAGNLDVRDSTVGGIMNYLVHYNETTEVSTNNPFITLHNITESPLIDHNDFGTYTGSQLFINNAIFKNDLISGNLRRIHMNGCYLTTPSIGAANIDLTFSNAYSSINYINGLGNGGYRIVENLLRYVSRSDATLYNGKGTRFINTNGNPVNGTPNTSWFLDIVI